MLAAQELLGAHSMRLICVHFVRAERECVCSLVIRANECLQFIEYIERASVPFLFFSPHQLEEAPQDRDQSHRTSC
jgi:hypothetical protein